MNSLSYYLLINIVFLYLGSDKYTNQNSFYRKSAVTVLINVYLKASLIMSGLKFSIKK